MLLIREMDCSRSLLEVKFQRGDVLRNYSSDRTTAYHFRNDIL